MWLTFCRITLKIDTLYIQKKKKRKTIKNVLNNAFISHTNEGLGYLIFHALFYIQWLVFINYGRSFNLFYFMAEHWGGAKTKRHLSMCFTNTKATNWKIKLFMSSVCMKTRAGLCLAKHKAQQLDRWWFWLFFVS